MKRFIHYSPMEFDDPLENFEPKEYKDEVRRALMEETVDAIPTHSYTRIPATTSVASAVKTLYDDHAACLLVVDNDDLVGIFTERDVLEKVAEQYDQVATHRVSEVMTTQPMVVYETDPAAVAVASIAIAGHRHVPVLRIDGSLSGVIVPPKVFQFIDQSDLDSQAS